MSNNFLDLSDKNNQLFIASILCTLCPITIDLQDIEKFWYGDVSRLHYDLKADTEGKTGTITFTLKDK